jgi:predicted metal-dependent hydrolase
MHAHLQPRQASRKPIFDLAKYLPQLLQITRGLVEGIARHNAEYFTPGFTPDHKNNYSQAEAPLRELGLTIAS